MNPPDLANQRPQVLVADDDELMRSLMTAALDEKGFDTIEVEDGAEALSAIQQNSPDLVVLDVNMPVMNGYEACERIRGMPNCRDLPVVIVTGNEDTESIDRAFECGATDFVSKPVNWSLIGYRMRYVLRGAQTLTALTSSEVRNRAMLEALPDRLIMISADGRILSVIEHNHDDAVSAEAFVGRPLESILPAEAARSAIERTGEVLTRRTETSFEFSDPDSGDACEPLGYYEVRVLAQSSDVALLILRNITQRKLAEQQIHQLAFYDNLTGLPNRHYFMQRAEEALGAARAEQMRYLLCCFNLDHFKRINDTLGHGAGDDALQQLARRLIGFRDRWADRACYLDIARLGSDEFALLCSLPRADDQNRILRALRSEFDVPVSCDRHQLVVSISLGTTLFPDDGDNVEALLRNADKAMSSAKLAGRNTYVAYDRSQHERSEDTLQLESDLRIAIKQNDLMLYFQPKFDLRTGVLTGAEALLRWIHHDRGMISPAVFIPLAEETGLIVDIDRWVVDRACRHLRDWRATGLDPVPLSINLSGREFSFDQPEITLQRAMHSHGIDPSLVELEITETVLMADPVAAAATLNRLKAMGIRLAVDDFGTGYSSLGYLKRFPLDVLKIDREFIADLDENDSDRTLCRAMISMARGLGLEVVAEGIETKAQRDFLRYEGCQIGQGFLLARPMPADEYAQMLTGKVMPGASTTPASSEPPPVTH